MPPRTTYTTSPSDEQLGHRPRLLGLAYRMLGDMDEAEYVVQEAYVRWYQLDRSEVRSAEAWLVTVVSRLAVDRLRRLTTERAAYPGPWLPQPIATGAPDAPGAPSVPAAPDRRAELGSDLSVALLVLLERLAPDERAAFLLRDVFGTEYVEIARILERRTDAVRQVVRRARARVHAERPRVPVPPEAHGQLLERFLAALAADDAPALLALLAPDVVLASDGGGRVAAARNRLVGPDRVSRFLLGVARRFGPAAIPRLTWLNGEPALLTVRDDALIMTTTLAVDGGHVRAVYLMRNPAKLRRALEIEGPIA